MTDSRKDHLQNREKRPHYFTEYWPVMTFYERFEHIIALILSFIITLVVIAALVQLIREVFNLLLLGALNPLEHQIFQVIFGMMMTLLIAMEFKHSILGVVKRDSHIVQARGVILIALLALARKFIIIDLGHAEPLEIVALSFAVLVLGGVYYFLRKGDADRA